MAPLPPPGLVSVRARRVPSQHSWLPIPLLSVQGGHIHPRAWRVLVHQMRGRELVRGIRSNGRAAHNTHTLDPHAPPPFISTAPRQVGLGRRGLRAVQPWHLLSGQLQLLRPVQGGHILLRAWRVLVQKMRGWGMVRGMRSNGRNTHTLDPHTALHLHRPTAGRTRAPQLASSAAPAPS